MIAWSLLLIFLILLAAFFSAAETSMMASNRYRLRHLARQSHVQAKRVLKLLQRPDRLLGVILIGSTFSNILASSVATLLFMHYFGEFGTLMMTLVLTFVVLLFGETAPKTLAAISPQRIAFLVSAPLVFLLKCFYPLVWIVNGLANGFLRLCGVRVSDYTHHALSLEELRTMVYEATGKTSMNFQDMLLGVLDLQQVTVNEAMIPKNEIYGIDLIDEWDTIVQRLLQCPHSHLPIYRENIHKVQGMLAIRQVLVLLQQHKINSKQDLLRIAEEVYFIPEGTLLHQQLLNFQHRQKTIGLIVDEYGDIQGMLTLRDVLEEIVGEFSVGASDINKLYTTQKDGSVLVDGAISVRDLNRMMKWHLPSDGPRTLSGLIIEELEMIPKTALGIRINGYPIEVMTISKNMIKQVRVWPKLYVAK